MHAAHCSRASAPGRAAALERGPAPTAPRALHADGRKVLLCMVRAASSPGAGAHEPRDELSSANWGPSPSPGGHARELRVNASRTDAETSSKLSSSADSALAGASPSATPAPLRTEDDDGNAGHFFGESLTHAIGRVRAYEDYRTLLSGRPEDVDLFRAALLIAKHAYPDLDEAQCAAQLDALAVEASALLPEGEWYPLRVLRAINTVLYERHGFAGNTADYYSRDNSCINKASAAAILCCTLACHVLSCVICLVRFASVSIWKRATEGCGFCVTCITNSCTNNVGIAAACYAMALSCPCVSICGKQQPLCNNSNANDVN